MNQNIGQRIKERREQLSLSLQDVADKMDVNRSSIMRWENGETSRIKLPMLERLAQFLQTTPEYLMGYEQETKANTYSRSIPPESACLLPILKNITSEEITPEDGNIIDYALADAACRHDCFFLRVSESAMAPRLDENDDLLVRRQNTLANGELGVFLLDGNTCIIRLYYQEERLELHSFNPYYPTLRFHKNETDRVRIIGKIIESRRKW